MSASRILTTHVGSLPRHNLLDLMKAKLAGGAYDRKAYDACVRSAVEQAVGKQVECGIDIVTTANYRSPGSSLTCASD